MEITAHKDPETGLIFETAELLAIHQQARRNEKTALEAAEKEKKAREQARSLMCRELASKEQFPDLVRQMYEAAFRERVLHKGRKHPEIKEITVSCWKLDEDLTLQVGLEVLLSCDPDNAYKESYQGFRSLTPPDVLFPFRLWGAGNSTKRPNGYCMRYGLQAGLSNFPLLRAAMLRADALLCEKEEHEVACDRAYQERANNDPRERELREKVSQALKALYEAQAAYDKACSLAQACSDELYRQVHASMPFPKDAELQAAKAASGLGNAGDVIVRKALREDEANQSRKASRKQKAA